MHSVTIGRFKIVSKHFYYDRSILSGEKDPVYINKEGATVVLSNCHARGFSKAEYLPYYHQYDYINECFEFIVVRSHPSGFEPAVEGALDAGCRGCQWLTGESCLPCAVNPLAFRQGCFDYQAE